MVIMSRPQTVFSILPSNFPVYSSAIGTEEFLNAATSAISLIERFGKAFIPIVQDMKENVKKLNTKYTEDKVSNKNLQEMILKENEKDPSTDALMWLRRALHFLALFFDSILNDSSKSENLADCLKAAYSSTLEQYHGWITKKIFALICNFVPNRKSLLYTLSLEQDDCESIVLEDMANFNENMLSCVSELKHFYFEHGLESNSIV